jgi:tetratricopeptide (TPR) repeat protein
MNRDYARALALFDRIELLELSAENHETVLYYKILATLKLPELKAGIELIDTFIEEFPESEFLPELLYSKADVMMKLGEKDSSIALFMRLLDSAKNESDASERQRTFWHQQAGNRLANRFYAEGDYSVALRIYQGMVELSEQSSWRIPVIYQIALCFEKMAMHKRAQESYLFIEQKMKPLDVDTLSPALRQIKENTAWRLKVIQWRIDAEEQAASLISQS